MDTIRGCLAGGLELTMEEIELLSKDPVQRRKNRRWDAEACTLRSPLLGKARGRWGLLLYNSL